MHTENLEPGTVLIVGGGPVGLITATTLAKYGVRSVILERNLTTTKWPKMDLTNARSVEIYQALGIAEELRKVAVPGHYPFTCLFSSGLHAEKAITAWNLPSPDEYQRRSREKNDGSMPSEPWLRVSQEIFEAWLKGLGMENPLIDFRAKWEVTSAHEFDSGAQVNAIHPETKEEWCINADFAVGCDGAHSAIRKSLDIPLEGGPIHGYAVLIHFKSTDLTRIQKQGQFWHLFFPNAASDGGSIKGAVIAQDEVDTWTIHRFMKPDVDHTQLSSEDIVYDLLGGMSGRPFPIQIDEVLVRSTWTPSVALARSYAGSKAKIFIAGDACHQTVPTGGYGMNTGIADGYDIGWKLAAVIQGWAGPAALLSYEQERRPVGELALQWSKVHMGNLMKMSAELGLDANVIDSDVEAGVQMRTAMHEYLQTHDGHNQSVGVEMGYRYSSNLCVAGPLDAVLSPPEFHPRKYTPSTMPGYRAPHVYLTTGKAISHLFGDGFTLVAFPESEELATSIEYFNISASTRKVPLEVVQLPGEVHAHKVWGAPLTLVRPDGFVSWHGDKVSNQQEADRIVAQASGSLSDSPNDCEESQESSVL
ncbi:FAD-dependent monooxygenase apdD [Penicillium oxalicum]|uniref:FAD-dependent monooxygenase apdD n=1 Tax=Penicillium oxalicum TaxID=69781 RepID=UPI0020B6D73A|nr:FAD-dependent monooxygenase apdD [Penicillium oxalicum]KAI2794200.1 FAD-dependent monooxygenase apdD [Penicillium oxalicum]